MAPIAPQAQIKNDGNLMGRILVKKDKLIVLCRKISFKTVIGHHKTYQVDDMYKRESFRCRIVSGEKKNPSSSQSKDVLIRIRQRIGSAKRRKRSDIWTPAHGGVEYSVFPKQREPIPENSVESITLLESHEKLRESRRSHSFTSKKEKKKSNGPTKTFIISKKDDDDDSPLDGNLTPIIRAVLDFDGKFDPEHRSSDVDGDDEEEDFDEDSVHRKCAGSKRKYVDVYDLEFRRGSLDESHLYSCNHDRHSSGSSSSFSHPRKRSLSHFQFDYDVFH